MLAHLKQLQALAVKGKHQGHGEPLQEHSFPGQLAAVQTLRTLHIDTIANGVSTVDDAISKLSRLQELHLLAKVMRAATIAPAQICKAAYDDHLVLQELILLPKLRSLAESCGIEELPDVLHSCTQLTFFCFQGRQSDFHLHIGSYLKNLEEIAIQNYLANASLLEQTTRVQLFFTTVLIVMACCVKIPTDICSLAMSVSNSYKMYVSWSAMMNPWAVQSCLLLSQLLTERCCRPTDGTVLQLSDNNGLDDNQLPWAIKAHCEIA